MRTRSKTAAGSTSPLQVLDDKANRRQRKTLMKSPLSIITYATLAHAKSPTRSPFASPGSSVSARTPAGSPIQDGISSGLRTGAFRITKSSPKASISPKLMSLVASPKLATALEVADLDKDRDIVFDRHGLNKDTVTSHLDAESSAMDYEYTPTPKGRTSVNPEMTSFSPVGMDSDSPSSHLYLNEDVPRGPVTTPDHNSPLGALKDPFRSTETHGLQTQADRHAVFKEEAAAKAHAKAQVLAVEEEAARARGALKSAPRAQELAEIEAQLASRFTHPSPGPQDVASLHDILTTRPTLPGSYPPSPKKEPYFCGIHSERLTPCCVECVIQKLVDEGKLIRPKAVTRKTKRNPKAPATKPGPAKARRPSITNTITNENNPVSSTPASTPSSRRIGSLTTTESSRSPMAHKQEPRINPRLIKTAARARTLESVRPAPVAENADAVPATPTAAPATPTPAAPATPATPATGWISSFMSRFRSTPAIPVPTVLTEADTIRAQKEAHDLAHSWVKEPVADIRDLYPPNTFPSQQAVAVEGGEAKSTSATPKGPSRGPQKRKSSCLKGEKLVKTSTRRIAKKVHFDHGSADSTNESRTTASKGKEPAGAIPGSPHPSKGSSRSLPADESVRGEGDQPRKKRRREIVPKKSGTFCVDELVYYTSSSGSDYDEDSGEDLEVSKTHNLKPTSSHQATPARHRLFPVAPSSRAAQTEASTPSRAAPVAASTPRSATPAARRPTSAMQPSVSADSSEDSPTHTEGNAVPAAPVVTKVISTPMKELPADVAAKSRATAEKHLPKTPSKLRQLVEWSPSTASPYFSPMVIDTPEELTRELVEAHLDDLVAVPDADTIDEWWCSQELKQFWESEFVAFCAAV